MSASRTTQNSANKIRVLLLTAIAVLVSFLLLSYAALGIFRNELTPEMQQKGRTLAESINDLVIKSVNYGVPFERLRGMEEYLDSLNINNPEVLYIGISDNRGRELYKSDANSAAMRAKGKVKTAGKTVQIFPVGEKEMIITTFPVRRDGQILGNIKLGMDGNYFDKMVDKILLDIITVGLVSLLVAFELLSFIISCYITSPMRTLHAYFERIKRRDFSFRLVSSTKDEAGDAFAAANILVDQVNQKYLSIRDRLASAKGAPEKIAQLREKLSTIESECTFAADDKPKVHQPEKLVEYIKWPFFLLIFSDALSISFFPHFVNSLYQPLFGLSREVVMGLPISVFMLVWALSLPWAGAWSDRVGRRKAFLYGALITSIGLFLSGTAHTLIDLMIWRSLTAIGYGLVFITSQAYINENTKPEQRTQGMAVFLSAFFAGSLCGAAIGGILSDRIGYQQTLFVSGFIALIAAFFAYKFVIDGDLPQLARKTQAKVSDYFRLLTNRHFFFVTFFSAIPAKIALTGFLYFCVPLFMKILGGDQSSTGRGMMAYGLVIVFFAPYIASHASTMGSRKLFMVVGGLLTAISLFILHFNPNVGAVILAVAMLGLAHAIGLSPQFPVISDLCAEECKSIGVGTVMGIFRMIERIGNVSGPILAAVLIAALGFKGTFLWLGYIALFAVTVLAIHLFILSRRHVAS